MSQEKNSEPLKTLQGKEPRLLSHYGSLGQNPAIVPRRRMRSLVGGVKVGKEMRAERKPSLGNTGWHSLTIENKFCVVTAF